MRVKPEPIKMTEVEKKEWSELYNYVKKEILFYDDNQNIPQNICRKLKGIRTGKFIENRLIENQAEYPYKIILYTSPPPPPPPRYADQEYWLHYLKKHFNAEMQKVNYICAIVKNNINDVYEMVKRKERNDEKVENMDTEILTHKAAHYQTKTKELKNDKLKNLW